MKRMLLIAPLIILAGASVAHAQFGSGIVFDPTQSAHAAQQIIQANQLYTTTIETVSAGAKIDRMTPRERRDTAE
jgi:hypothetical protein